MEPEDDGAVSLVDNRDAQVAALEERWHQLIRRIEKVTGLSLGSPPPAGGLKGSYPIPTLLDQGWRDSSGTIVEPFWVGRSREVEALLASQELRQAVLGFGVADRLDSKAIQGMQETHDALQKAARAARDLKTGTGERLLWYYPSDVADAVRVLATWTMRFPEFAAVRTGGKGRPRAGATEALRQVVTALDAVKAADGRDLDHEDLTILLMLVVPWRFLGDWRPREKFERLVDRVRKARGQPSRKKSPRN